MTASPPPWRVLETSSPEGQAETGPRRLRIALVGLGAAFALASSAVAVVATGAAPSLSLPSPTPEVAPSVDAGSSPPVAGSVVVQVAGAVVHPGVYRFLPGARVIDAIEAAGGYGPRVDPGRADLELDLAAKLVDGRTIRVPSRDDPTATGVPATGGTGSGSGTAGGLVDLNHATLAELDALPGVGPVTAQKIVDARRSAPFASPEDLQTRGIMGQKAYDRIKDLVTAR